MGTVIDPQHEGPRTFLRTAGPLLMILGAVLLVLGAVKMFSPAFRSGGNPSEGFMEGRRSFDEVSRRMNDDFHSNARTSFAGFGMVAAGMVCLAAGGVMTKFGYMGRVARYVAQEIAPVATDTVGFVVDETKDEMQTAARAISQGIAEGQRTQAGEQARDEAPAAVCPKCGASAEPGAKFCSKCGATMEAACPQCGRNVDPADRFCPNCGKPLA